MPITIYGTEWPTLCWCAVNKLYSVAHVNENIVDFSMYTSAVGDDVRPLAGGVAEYSAVGWAVEHARVASAARVVSVRQVRVVRCIARCTRRCRQLRTFHRCKRAKHSCKSCEAFRQSLFIIRVTTVANKKKNSIIKTDRLCSPGTR